MAGRMNSSKLHFLIIDAVQSLLENKYKIMPFSWSRRGNEKFKKYDFAKI